MNKQNEPETNAITVRDVTKIYRLYDKPIDRLKESLSVTHKNYHKDFYALQNLSFNVKKGETVGIIGTNGSGKSTILKIITEFSPPRPGKYRWTERFPPFWSWEPVLTRTTQELKIFT